MRRCRPKENARSQNRAIHRSNRASGSARRERGFGNRHPTRRRFAQFDQHGFARVIARIAIAARRPVNREHGRVGERSAGLRAVKGEIGKRAALRVTFRPRTSAPNRRRLGARKFTAPPTPPPELATSPAPLTISTSWSTYVGSRLKSSVPLGVRIGSPSIVTGVSNGNPLRTDAKAGESGVAVLVLVLVNASAPEV